MDKKIQSLNGRQKLLFGLVCWGVQSWSQANNFKKNGYDQKYKDATSAMYTGLSIYGLSFITFILILAFS